MSKFGNLGLGAITIGAALGYYVSSYSVAAERDRIEDLALQIADDEDAISRLQAELGVRASLTRLEDINAQVWNLKAPQPEQIVGGRVQLASWLTPDGAAGDVVRMEHAVVEDAGVRVTEPQPIRLADTKPEVPVPVKAAAPAAMKPAPAAPPVVVASAAAPVRAATPAPKTEDIFSADFIDEVAAAATLERAGFDGVALR
ncbi:MAG: hypothetical protein WA979_13495 [Pacificimonas sp.]